VVGSERNRGHRPPVPHDLSNHEICAEVRPERDPITGLVDFDVRNP